MNFRNLFGREDRQKKEDLRSKLNEAINLSNEDRTEVRNHINPQEYMDALIKYKSGGYKDLETYSPEMDEQDESMATVKSIELVNRLKDSLR